MADQTPTHSKQPFAMGALISPPEPHRPDSFDCQLPSVRSVRYLESVTPNQRLPSMRNISQPISPPISPHTYALQESGQNEEAFNGDRDPQLFPETQSSLIDDLPLFKPVHNDQVQNSHRTAIEEHIRQRTKERPAAHIPSQEEYELIAATFSSKVTFTSKVIDNIRRDPKAWIDREMEYFNMLPPLLPQKPSAQVVSKGSVTARTPTAKKERVSKPTNVPKRTRVKRTHKPSPKVLEMDSFDAAHVPYTPETKAVRARSVPHKDDVEYNSLKDYSPPLSTLAHSDRPLKTDWKGQPLDLSNDPDRHMLHEAELNVASALRLSCAQYLCSKRRIFISRLECLMIGKEFRKTTAQQACKIDVNKASKLWTAFDKVHWFDPVHMQRFLA